MTTAKTKFEYFRARLGMMENASLGGSVDDYSCVRHPPGHRPEREPLSWVCSSYLRQNWNVVLASSLQRVEMILQMILLCNAVRKKIC
jgi:hypothetical protein